jgi:HD-GYP domain-containing protein (c-di-GMP phosphodiesterase class II)
MPVFKEFSQSQLTKLLSLTEKTIREMTGNHLPGFELYAEGLRHVLSHSSQRGPSHIFIAMLNRKSGDYAGCIHTLLKSGNLHASEIITIPRDGNFAIHLAGEEVVINNWSEDQEQFESYQSHFHPQVKSFLGVPVRNFVVYRIHGEKPGEIIAFNYPETATDQDAEILRGLAIVFGSLLSLSSSIRQTEKAFIYTIEALARSCEAADEDTGNHIVRVNRYSEALAKAIGMPDDYVATIARAAQMHDVGKVHVPSFIIRKEGPLTAEEFAIMKQHPEFGAKIIGEAPKLAMAREIALTHHENWDGSGYPNRLKGEEIPLSGRIVKLADIYDALRSKRSYKPAFSHEKAVHILTEGDERTRPHDHFSAQILSAFYRIEADFLSIYQELTD